MFPEPNVISLLLCSGKAMFAEQNVGSLWRFVLPGAKYVLKVSLSSELDFLCCRMLLRKIDTLFLCCERKESIYIVAGKIQYTAYLSI